ncbi:DMT family transporter [Adlercreutzia aquisgranensis]|uniref:DMT family transporter n=1 Tax=Muribaculaceae bacterium Z82 TaxID=2304548 RepID=A0A7C9JDK2_9BACT|nr:DMT family transporter [Adlercreutzia aquisgranensis]
MGALSKTKFGLTSGILWALDTVILGIALGMSPYIDTVEAIAFGAIASSALHDMFCAVWLFIYMGVRGRLKDTWRALRTRSGKVVVLGALLGGPIGMTGYVVAINNIGPGYTAIISAFYPAVGAILSYLILKERMSAKQLVAFFCAMGGIVAMGVLSMTDAETTGNAALGLVGAAACVIGWGSEAVLCGWGMKDDLVDNETALQIRETTSGIVYAAVVLPAFGAWAFTASAVPSAATGVVALAALAGTVSYLFYYKSISSPIGAAKSMALNISYSAWAVLFAFLLQGTVPTAGSVVCCVVILAGTILAASDWEDLFGRKGA